jgi:hypothetical protein
MRLDLITVICGSTTAKKKSQTLAGKCSAQPRFCQIRYVRIIYGSQGLKAHPLSALEVELH